MEKEGDKPVLDSDTRDFLNHAVMSLEEAEKKLEESYNNRNPNRFNALKKFMLKINKSISETI